MAGVREDALQCGFCIELPAEVEDEVEMRHVEEMIKAGLLEGDRKREEEERRRESGEAEGEGDGSYKSMNPGISAGDVGNTAMLPTSLSCLTSSLTSSLQLMRATLQGCCL